MNFIVPDFAPAAPEIFVAVMILLVLLLSAFAREGQGGMAFLLSMFTIVGAAIITIGKSNTEVTYALSNMYVADSVATVLKLGIYLSMLTVLCYSREYLLKQALDKAEYYIIALFAMLGMMVMASASNMLSLYVGLELMSLSLYGLVAYDRDSAVASEAAMKYFVLGALASGMLLYGMSLVYGATGSLGLADIGPMISTHGSQNMALLLGLVFIVVGIAFKLGVVPFHMWIPDVYQGAPTCVTLLISSAPKLAAFAIAYRLLAVSLISLAEQWQNMLIILAVASIVMGNLVAIAQTSIKRMLAYSGISHMGFMLLGLLAGVVKGNQQYVYNAYGSAMFYALIYVLMSLAAFGMLIVLSKKGEELDQLDDLKGLNKRQPWFAVMFGIIMFSMAGIPFFAGFWAKLAVLQSVIAAGHIWLAVLAVIMSLVGAYYYLRVVKLMYFDEPIVNHDINIGGAMRLVLSINVLLIIALGILPSTLLQICVEAVYHAL